MSTCRDFRELLLHELEGRTAPAELARLSWHEHLLGCEDCRRVLAEEEALEILLSEQPEPRLPAALAQRVLERLRAYQVDALDRLLALDDDPPVVPHGLARTVLGGLAHERASLLEDARLDRLLDADPGIEVPDGLAERVLAGLADERSPRSLRRVGGSFSRMLTAAAAGLVFVLVVAAAWRFARTLREREPEPVVTPTPLPASTDEEFVATLERLDQEALLEKLDVVEHLDFLKGLSAADLDVASTFGFEDEVLQELDEWTANDADDAEDPEEKGG